MSREDTRSERLITHARAIRDEARGMAHELHEARSDMRQALDFSRSVREHPFGALLVAAGVGYVLGGGLFAPLTRRLVRTGVRAMVLPLLTRQLELMVAGHAPPRSEDEPGA